MVCAMEVLIKLRHQEIVFSDHHPKNTKIRTTPTLLILNLFSECNLQVTLGLITKPTSNLSDFISVQFFSDFLSSVLHVFLAEVLTRDYNWTNSPRCCSTRVSSLYNTV